MYSDIKIGVLGGGQLGRMFGLAAANFGIHPYYLDKSKEFPAGLISQRFTEGDITDEEDVYAFGKDMDVITIEIENVNTKALHRLKLEGKKVFPDPEIIDLIKDKGLQKEFYKENNLPSSDFILVKDKAELQQKINDKEITFPFVQKSRTGGYDGKGVTIIKSENNLADAFDTPSVIEQLVEIKKELAVIVARNESGESRTFPTVEMIFDPKLNLVDYLLAPAGIEVTHDNICQSAAINMAEKLNLIGILAIEFFLDINDNILINEMAPRTHNSGHFSMDACITSQFEQHLRSIINLPLGDTTQHSKAMMFNILGPEEYIGPVKDEFLKELSTLSGIHPHIYGKIDSKPGRKLGHANYCFENKLDQNKINRIKKLL